MRTIRASLWPGGGILLAMLLCAAPARAAEIDYSAYAAALKHVDARGMVNYRALKAAPRDLDRFLGQIAKLDRATYDAWSEKEKIAFWTNAYNAITLKVILNYHPIESSWAASLRYPKNSIRQISGVWDKLKFTVMGRAMTLDEIEHETLRKQFTEPRIHMALVCAAMGCPPLRNEPYAGARLDDQFDDQAKSFLGNDKKFRIDRRGGKVYLSPIFKWFGADFEKKWPSGTFAGHDKTESAVLNFVSQHLSPADARYLRTARYKVEYLDYDWSLNEQ